VKTFPLLAAGSSAKSITYTTRRGASCLSQSASARACWQPRHPV